MTCYHEVGILHHIKFDGDRNQNITPEKKKIQREYVRLACHVVYCEGNNEIAHNFLKFMSGEL